MDDYKLGKNDILQDNQMKREVKVTKKNRKDFEKNFLKLNK